MATKYECDRCKVLMNHGDKLPLQRTEPGKGKNFTVYEDLCKACNNALQRFMKPMVSELRHHLLRRPQT